MMQIKFMPSADFQRLTIGEEKCLIYDNQKYFGK